MNKQEDFQNRALAKLLSERGVSADYEQRSGRKRMDVVAQVDGLRIILEAETGFHRKAQAIKDADARLRQNLATVVFAVCYPTGVTEDNLAAAELTWTVRLKPGEPAGEWSTGGLTQLAQAVLQAPRSLSGADLAARMLSLELDGAVQRLNTSVRKDIARTLDLPATKSDGDDQMDSYFVAAKRGMLVVATAMLFHGRVQQHLPAECPEGYYGQWPPASVSACAEQESVIDAFQEAWRGILAVDYKPVFETGRTALLVLPIDPDTSQAISSLAKMVMKVSEHVAGLRHDLLGRIFHWVLDTARYDGSFYTSTAAAVLLATLALPEEDGNWSDPNFIASLRICDPACGTGTLLMAAAERIRDLRNAAGRSDPEDEETLDLHLVEDVLWGYDVNLTATHMAASTLGMLSPTTRFHRMNIHRTLLGVFEGVPYLGSLEFLSGQARLVDWPSIAQQVESGDEAAELPPPMDLVIMNPPFTRDSLRHDQFSFVDEDALRGREKKIFDGRPIHLAGNSGGFLILADHLSKKDTGTIAAILPLAGITDRSGLEIRRFLGSRYYVDTIVTSHDPSRIFFSENTSIGEILLVCRRWDSEEPKPSTRVVNLAKNPTTPLEALDTAARIKNASGEASRDFTIQYVDSTRIQRGDWFAVNFLSPFLVEAYRTLSETSPSSVPTVPLSALAYVGPEGRRIRDVYTNSQMPTASGRRALWHHKTDVTKSIRAETDVYIEPKPYSRERRLADKYWEQRSRMLLPTQLWLPLVRVASAMLSQSAVGSRWVPCLPHNPEILKALCLYLNSTPGLLSLLGERDNRKPSYPSFSLDTLRSLPVPNLAVLGAAELGMLDDCFDRLGKDELLPFPRMDEDPVRRQIDEAVTQALGIDPEWVATIRRELAREPSVTDRSVLENQG